MHSLLLASQWIGEQPANANYVHKTVGLLTDPAHLTVEIIVNTIEALMVFGFGFVVGKRALRRQHAELDAEHGITHGSE